MTRVSILEYVEAVRGRYHQVSKKEKGVRNTTSRSVACNVLPTGDCVRITAECAN